MKKWMSRLLSTLCISGLAISCAVGANASSATDYIDGVRWSGSSTIQTKYARAYTTVERPAVKGDTKNVFSFVTFIDFGYQTTERYEGLTDTETSAYCGKNISEYDEEGRMISMISSHQVKLNGYANWSNLLNTGDDV